MTVQEKHLELKELELHVELLKISMALENMNEPSATSIFNTFKNLLSLSNKEMKLATDLQEI